MKRYFSVFIITFMLIKFILGIDISNGQQIMGEQKKSITLNEKSLSGKIVNVKNLSFESGYCNIKGPDFIEVKEGASIALSPIPYKELQGFFIPMLVPKKENGLITAPITVQFLNSNKETIGEVKNFYLSGYGWNQEKSTIDLIYSDRSVRIIMHSLLMLGNIGGFVINGIEIKNMDGITTGQDLRENKTKSQDRWEKAVEFVKKGRDFQKNNQFDEAVEYFTKAIVIGGLNLDYTARVYNSRGISYIKKNQYARAIEDFDKAIDLFPRHALPYYNKACIYSLINNTEAACIWLKKAIEKGYDRWDQIKSDGDLENIRNSTCYRQIISER